MTGRSTPAGSSSSQSSRNRQAGNDSGRNTHQDASRSTGRGTSTTSRGTAQDSRQRSGDSRSSSTTSRTGRGTSTTSRGTAQDSRQPSGDSRSSSTTSRDRQIDSANRSRDSRGSSTSNRGNATRRDDVRGRTTQDQRVVVNNRRDNTRVRVSPNHRQHTSNHRVYKRKNYRHHAGRRVVHVKPHLVISPVYYHRPHVYINVEWPWQNRYYRNWNPHYRYKQVVYVNIGHGSHYRRARIDVRTEYQQEVRYADNNKAVIDIYLDKIEVYEDGYFYGEVYRIPDHLSHIEATVYRNGEVVYDRDVFIVGDPQAGFEMISTRHYGGYVLDYYDRSHGYKVGKLDFRRKRVYTRRYSKLFDAYGRNGFAPISLLPEEHHVADYGYDSVSYNYYNDDYDPYYGGNYDDDYYDYYDDGSYYKYEAPRNQTYGRSSSPNSVYNKQSVQARIAASGPININNKQTVTTQAGIAVNIEREGKLERIR